MRAVGLTEGQVARRGDYRMRQALFIAGILARRKRPKRGHTTVRPTSERGQTGQVEVTTRNAPITLAGGGQTRTVAVQQNGHGHLARGRLFTVHGAHCNGPAVSWSTKRRQQIALTIVITRNWRVAPSASGAVEGVATGLTQRHMAVHLSRERLVGRETTKLVGGS